ncbi:hypothetical protein [Flagellimonas zhangzhouensis]|uniref:Multidrug transporter n=1 Tax=Flagellimonas zhangzhouensis TaxID=1073328 RepID=A0A1H2YDP4_9FLAO|nr:hypothetical protein [Allomuricauda zhangzhouensis]SDQ96842.1 hypothetical protein SAMN05216294_2985 [Allomuricauda zhangzhouensis]SDX03131.1 hypothetical protein SAMN04487892_3036 [Allomuricauda zhangzhouensis]
MKKKRIFLMSLVSAALIATSCSSDSTTDPQPPVAQKDGQITAQDDPDLDPTDLKGDVTSNVTLTADQTWSLSGSLIVKPGATLTIEPGTKVEAQAGGTNVFIAVEQDGKIDASGTASNPITLTSGASNPRPGDWGGLIIAGRAPINLGETATAEVVGLTYGGTVSDDSSGTIKYVIVEYSGARINGEQEFNGFTFYGVGSGTVVDNIAAYNGDDDGVEFFGGTVNATNILIVNAKDDMFDWTDGWTGTASNLYGIREYGYNDVTSDPRGIEADSNADNNDATPRANPTISDITLIHQSTVELSDMIKIRRGSAGTITNALVGIQAAPGESAGTAADFIDLTDSAGPGSPLFTIDVTVFGVLDATDIKNEVGATINVVAGNTGADVSAFAWTGYTFPTIN